MAHGEPVLKVLFNNNAPLYCGSNCCSATEWEIVREKVYAGTRRQLRGDNNVDEETVEDSITNVVADNESRELLTYPRECEKLCSTYPSGRCMALKCLGFRNRMLQYNSCGTQMIAFRNLVKTIASIPELGVDCKALLKAPALMTCVNYPC